MPGTDQSYGRELLTVAPVFAAKAVLGDLPKGSLEYAIEQKVGGSKSRLSSLLKKGLRGRGAGRALGAGLAVATAPMFLRGVRLTGSDDPVKKKKGLKYLLGSSALYTGTKGLTEGFRESRVGGLGRHKAFAAGAERGAIKALVKSPAALLMGLSIAAGRKKGKKGEESGHLKKLVLPALAGAASSGGSRFAEGALSSILRRQSLRKALRRAVPKAVGGAAAGALGGLALASVTDAAVKALKQKRAAVTAPAPAPVQEHKTGIPALKPWFAPYPHQAAAIDKMYANKGKILLAHEIGTGKTATAIYGFEKMRHEGKAKAALVVVPSGLRSNFGESGIKKFTNSDYQIVGSLGERRRDPRVVRPEGIVAGKPYTLISYAMFRRDPEGAMQRSGADTLILDELHKTRNERAQVFKAAIKARRHAVNVIGMTASPISNDPSELATLLTITEGRRIISPAQFKRLFVKTVGFAEGFSGGKKPVQDLKNKAQLLQLAYPRVDYVGSESIKSKTMPRKDLKTIQVPMSKEQWDLYQLALDRLGPIKKYLMRRDKEVSLKEAQFIFTALTQARQVSNSVHMGRKNITLAQSAERTPKMKTMLDDTMAHLAEDPKHKVVLYSNLVRGGVDVLAAGMIARGIKPAIFVGKGTDIQGTKITGPVRQQGVTDYKAGKKRVIILSGAGAEGLDLKDSTAFYSADGHFNPERVNQAEGRARRLGGQQFRTPLERRVDVRRYQSVVPAGQRVGFLGKLIGRKTPQTTDEWTHAVAARKAQKTKSFKETMREPSKFIRKYQTAAGNTVYVYPEGHRPTPRKKSWEFWK